MVSYQLSVISYQLLRVENSLKLLGGISALKCIRFAVLLMLAAYCLPITVSAQKDRAISEVQGERNVSPFDGQTARLTGIVTARARSGFFLQSPDDKTDNNPATSEGIFVFTKSEPDGEATVGNLISVTGTVTEFRPKAEPASLSITELSTMKDRDTIKVVSKGNALPKPITLTAADFAANKIDQLEKYEGMRVAVETLTTVAPTKGRVDDKTGTSVSDGVFYGVLKGIPRPFREPGMDIYDIGFASDKEKERLKKNFPKIPIFDSNPETLRVDSDEQLGAQAINVTSNAEIKNLVGVLHYGYQKYTILPDADGRPTISNLIRTKPLTQPTERQLSLAGMNLENFFDDEDDPKMKEDIVTSEAFQNRMKKISMAIRDYLRFPDVIGTIEVENLAVLKKLADKINTDAVAANQTNPKYEAYLIEGNDGRGIDVGFLVKSARVKVVDVTQLSKDEKFKNPDGKDENLHDRPPLMLQATIDDAKTGKPFAFTVIVNHLKSFLGIDDPKDGGARVRLKRQMQAKFLARFVNERQKLNPNEPIVLLGDFNAYQFNDGIGDIIGVIKGTPAPKDQVLTASEDLVNPDLTDLVDLIKPEQRYSYSFDGNAQDIDHIIVTQAMKKHLAGYGFARFNADFPEIYRNDPNRVERFSDHDAAIGYFNFDETASAK
jgi:predicted extracellular nuclease